MTRRGSDAAWYSRGPTIRLPEISWDALLLVLCDDARRCASPSTSTCPRADECRKRLPAICEPLLPVAAVALAVADVARGKPSSTSPQISVVGSVSSPAATPGSMWIMRESGASFGAHACANGPPTDPGRRRDRRASSGAWNGRCAGRMRRHVSRGYCWSASIPRYRVIAVLLAVRHRSHSGGIHAAWFSPGDLLAKALDRAPCTVVEVVSEAPGDRHAAGAGGP